MKNLKKISGSLLKDILTLSGIIQTKIELWRRNNPDCVIEVKCMLNNTMLGHYVTLLRGATLNNSYVDNYSYIGMNSIIDNVSIGRFCSLEPDLKIGLVIHPTSQFVSTYPAFYSANNGGCAKK